MTSMSRVSSSLMLLLIISTMVGGQMDCGETFYPSFMSALSAHYPFENVFKWNAPELVFTPFGKVEEKKIV